MHDYWRTLKAAIWLGWQAESNWTSPFLFAVYVVIKPFMGSLILVGMYFAARSVSSTVPRDYLPFLYVSNACFALVGAVMFGMSFAVISDREHYRMLKYIYVSPAHLQTYIVGRGVARSFQALLGGCINIGLGLALFAEVRAALDPAHIAWGWLLYYTAVGAAMLLALGVLLSGVVLNMGRQAMFLSEGLAGLMYFACGVVFPLSALPEWVKPISLVLPPTYWLEAMRRAVLEPTAIRAGSPLADWTHPQLAGMLTATTAVLAVLAHEYFRFAERRAWRRGRLEMTTGV